MRRRHALVAAAAAASVVLLTASPAWAHGIAVRGDLPLPTWLFAVGAGGALLVSFAALRFLWPRPRLEDAAAGVELGVQPLLTAGTVALRVVGLVAFFVTAWAAIDGADTTLNFSALMVYVIFWVGLQIICALVGDVWPALSPFETVAHVGAWLRQRTRPEARARELADDSPWRSHWFAAAGLAAFAWLELAFFEPANPHVLAGALLGYAATILVLTARLGRGWLRLCEPFAVLFGLLGHVAPFFRDDDGRLRARIPFSGISRISPIPGTVAVVMVMLGGTTFDGLSRTQLWADVVGSATRWKLTLFNTVGLTWTIGLVTLAYLGACWLVARLSGEDHHETVLDYVGSLVPIVLAYAIAHYFSLVVFEGQRTIAMASDPLQRGWDIFGTADWRINYLLISTAAIAYVQAAAIVIGHVAGVVTAHDRAVELHDPKTAFRAQYPLLGVMILYTVGGLSLLLGA